MPSNIRGSDNFDSAVAGHVIQVANYTTGAYQACTTLTQFDNTIPQNTEGTEVMSLAFTPKKANSKLRITVTFATVGSSVANWIIGALFRDANTDALGVVQCYQSTANWGVTLPTIDITVDAVSTSLTTFKVRFGANNAGTHHFNSPNGTLYYGGKFASSITITEIAQ